MTLTELAKELKKTNKYPGFGYLTVDHATSDQPLRIRRWGKWVRPTFNAEKCKWICSDLCYAIDGSYAKNLDLFEYADENGDIDYSKCIVEVE